MIRPEPTGARRRARRRARVPPRRARRRTRRRPQRRHHARGAQLHRLSQLDRLGVLEDRSPGPARRRATSCGSASSASSTNRTSDAQSSPRSARRRSPMNMARSTAPRSPRWATRSPRCATAGHEVLVVSLGRRRRRRRGARAADPPDRHAHAAGGVGGGAEPDHAGVERRARRASAWSARRCWSTRTTSSNRTQYLHARQTLGGCSSSVACRSINENDAIANDDDPLRRQRPHRGAGGALVERRRDGAADRPRRAVHRRSADRSRRAARRRTSRPTIHCCRSEPAPAAAGAGAVAWRASCAAARIASWSGVRTVIANAAGDRRAGRRRRRRRRRHRRSPAHDRRLPARKLWIAFAAEVAGAIVVDDGAQRRAHRAVDEPAAGRRTRGRRAVRRG